MELNVAQEQEEPAKYTPKRVLGKVIFKKEDFYEVIDAGKKIEQEQHAVIEGAPVYYPVYAAYIFTTYTFAKLYCNQHMQKTLDSLGYSKMTSIYYQAIEKIMASQGDFVIRAPTGSGKSLAVFLPLALKYFNEKRNLKVLVISPTRELSLQSAQLLQRLLNGSQCVVSAIAGGTARDKEKAVLRRGCCFLVCTVGRLLDHLYKTESLKGVFSQIETVVVDECDQLLELGCMSYLAAIFERLGRARRIFMSATINQQVLALVNKQMKNPTLLQAEGGQDSGFALPVELVQRFTVTTCKARLAVLFSSISHEFIGCPEVSRNQPDEADDTSSDSSTDTSVDEPATVPVASKSVLVFAASRAGVDFLFETAQRLRRAFKGFLPYQLYYLHGGMDQEFRTKVFMDFKRTGGVMFATDVAARGLNLNDDNSGVSAVIQFDAPSSMRQYIHRAGRAGRAGVSGTSLLILLPGETYFVKLAAKETHRTLQHLPCDMLGYVLGFRMGIRAFEKIQTEIEAFGKDDDEFKQLAENAFLQYLSGYSSRDADLREAFHVGTLHSGHIAKSFGLYDAPRLVAKNRAARATSGGQAPGKLVKGSARRGTKVYRGEYDDRVVM